MTNNETNEAARFLKDRDDPPLWPYNPSTNIIAPDLARSIRAWALTDGGLSEAQLHALSQRQALRAYIDGCIVPTLDKVLKRQRTAQEAQEAARVALDSGGLLDVPLKAEPSALLDPREAGGFAPGGAA